MEKTATEKYMVEVTKPNSMVSQAKGEGYILFNKVHRNAIVMTADGSFSTDDHIAILTCIESVMGKECFKMAIAVMDLKNHIMFSSGEIREVGE